VIHKQLLASAAHIEPAAANTFVTDDDTVTKTKKKKPAAARAPQPAAQQLHRDHHRHGDRGGGNGGDGGDDGGGGDRPPDKFVPDAQICAEFGGITKMTLHRWTGNRDLDFPPPIHIAGRSYRSRRMIEAFKERQVRAAIAAMSDPALRRRQPEALASEEVAARKAQRVREAHARRRSAAGSKP
jgi:hypothetical protein